MPLVLIIGAVIAIIGAAGYFMTQNSSEPADLPAAETEVIKEENSDAVGTLPVTEEPDEDDPAVSEVVDTVSAPAAASAEYADGTYTSNASYFTPRNTEHDIGVTITVEDDVITAANVTYDGGDAKTSSHSRFDAAYQAAVVGVALEDISLSRVGGASLTSDAFNEAVDTIKAKADA